MSSTQCAGCSAGLCISGCPSRAAFRIATLRRKCDVC